MYQLQDCSSTRNSSGLMVLRAHFFLCHSHSTNVALAVWSALYRPTTTTEALTRRDHLLAQAPSLITESSLTPAPFYVKNTENSQDWVTYFTRYVTFKQLPQPASLALFTLLMRGAANTWFCSLSDAVLDRFRTMYAPAPISLWRRASELWNRD